MPPNVIASPARSRLFLEQEMPRAELIPFAAGEVAVFSTRSPGKETPNEDAAGLIPFGERSGILAVSDGAGGSRGGGDAARLTLEALAAALQRAAAAGEGLRTAVLNGIEQANAAVTELGTGAAATVSVVGIDDGAARPFHVGDSVILVTGQRGRLKHVNISHGPVGYAVEAGLLDESEALHHEERHVVSNLVGSTEMRIEIGPRVRLARRDTILLASDGLSDNLYVEEIVERVRMGRLEPAARGVADLCRRRMTAGGGSRPCKPDDLTFILYRPNG
jgi:serine/threonine protein phosphatase PrpC